ncbi:uncharacterized protein [Leptinotarsa decemlineata]|uniref:uncharacterized protein n=1 Tax=Leptinotarsa decemlineata TaxID=7539 RepID=UPI003D306DCD
MVCTRLFEREIKRRSLKMHTSIEVEPNKDIKRPKIGHHEETEETFISLLVSQPQQDFTQSENTMMCAVQISSSEQDLIGDFSSNCSLPLVQGRHQDLKSISPQTSAQLRKGPFDDGIGSFKVIDCRYPYEFERGHITGAVNLYNRKQCMQLLNDSQITAAHSKGTCCSSTGNFLVNDLPICKYPFFDIIHIKFILNDIDVTKISYEKDNIDKRVCDIVGSETGRTKLSEGFDNLISKPLIKNAEEGQVVSPMPVFLNYSIRLFPYSSLQATATNSRIIDCRYPYEFECGDIIGAANLYTREQCIQLLKDSQITTAHSNKMDSLLFHCEFSSKRGPDL